MISFIILGVWLVYFFFIFYKNCCIFYAKSALPDLDLTICLCTFYEVSQGSWVRYPVWQHTFVSPSAFSRRAVVSYRRKYVHEVLVNRLGGLSLPRKSVMNPRCKWVTVELQWLEHWLLFHHGCFELVLGSLTKNPIDADIIVFGDNFGWFAFYIDNDMLCVLIRIASMRRF